MSDSLRNLAALSLIVGLAAGGALAEDKDADKPSGCFVTLYDGDNFRDKSITLTGPATFESMRVLPGAQGKNWSHEADSLKVGPTARVEAFAEPKLHGAHQRFEQGTQEAHASFEFASLRLDCEAAR